MAILSLVTPLMNAVRFLDTNILMYALDLDAGSKRQSALRLIETGWHARHPAKIGTSCRKKTQNPCFFSAKRSSSSLSERAGSFFRRFLMLQTSASFEVRQAARANAERNFQMAEAKWPVCQEEVNANVP